MSLAKPPRLAALLLGASLCASGGTRADPVADGNAGLEAMKSGDYEQAIVLFTHVLASPGIAADDKELAYTERGLARLYRRDFSEATTDFHHALQIKPDDVDASHGLTMAQANKTPDDDVKLPNSGGAAQQSAAPPPAAHHSKLPGGFFGALLESVNQGVCQGLTGVGCAPLTASSGGGEQTTAPPRPHVHTPSMDIGNAGLTALNKGDYPRAIQLFTRAINAGDLPPEEAAFAYLNRGEANAKLGHDSAALSDVNHALQLDPGDGDAQAAFADLMKNYRHSSYAGPPQDLASCTANYVAHGSFLKGKVYTTWAAYPRLSPIDAYAGAFNAAGAYQWTVTKVDSDAGTLSATLPVPPGEKVLNMDVTVEPLSPVGSKTSIRIAVGPVLIATDMKETMCHILADLSR